MKLATIKEIISGDYSLDKIYQKLKFRFFTIFCTKNHELKTLTKHWVVYQNLFREYSYFLNSLNYTEGSKEYSNKIWWCWLQGEDKAPDLCKACLDSLRYHLKNKEIIVITEKNMWDYVEFPEHIKVKYNKGLISRTHFSDLLRLELLIRHGGTWIDSSVFCTAEDNNIFDSNLYVYQNFMRGDEAIVASSWLISSEKNNPILCTTRDLLYKYWKKNDYLIHYYLFHFFFKMATEKYKLEWQKMPRYSNIPPHILQFEIFDSFSERRLKEIKKMSNFHKLTQKSDLPRNIENTFYEYIIKRKWKNSIDEV